MGKSQREYYLRNRAAIKVKQAERRKKNLAADPNFYAKHAERNRRYRQANPGKARAWNWKAAGVPTPLYDAPAACECCGKPPREGQVLHADHDHATGRFRGWLCRKCNLGLGLLGDSFDGVANMIGYLNKADLL